MRRLCSLLAAVMAAVMASHGSARAAILFVGLGWTVAAVSIAVSIVVTGNFLFEYAPGPGQPEIVSPYFKIAAPAALLPLALAGLILSGAWLRVRRR